MTGNGIFRITHEDGQEFESDEYILSDTNRYNSGDIHIKTEDETVHHSPDFNSEHQDGNQDNDDVISVNRYKSVVKLMKLLVNGTIFLQQ